MTTRFKVFASYNILQYMSDLIHVPMFVNVSKCQKKSPIYEYSDFLQPCVKQRGAVTRFSIKERIQKVLIMIRGH